MFSLTFYFSSVQPFYLFIVILLARVNLHRWTSSNKCGRNISEFEINFFLPSDLFLSTNIYFSITISFKFKSLFTIFRGINDNCVPGCSEKKMGKNRAGEINDYFVCLRLCLYFCYMSLQHATVLQQHAQHMQHVAYVAWPVRSHMLHEARVPIEKFSK